MKKFALASLALAAALAITPAASASSIPFSITDYHGFTLTGTFTGTLGGGGVYTMTAFTGTLIDTEATPAINTPGTGTVLDTRVGSGEDELFWSTTLNPTTGTNFSTHGIGFYAAGPNDYLLIHGLTTPGFGLPSGETQLIILFSSGASVAAPVTGTFGFAPLPGGGFGLSPAPEPTSLLLLGTGLFGLAILAFRKARTSGPVLNS